MPWIRLMLRECVGPEQARQLCFPASIVTTDAVDDA